MKQVVLLISMLLILVLTAGLVGGCKPSNKDSSGIKNDNSTDAEIDVNDIFGTSDTSDTSDTSGSNDIESESDSSNESSPASTSGGSSTSSSGDASSSNSQSSSSGNESVDYEDPNSWTKPVKIPAKKS